MSRSAKRLLIVFSMAINVCAGGSFVAYQDALSFGNQSAANIQIGMDFDVISPIVVSALGAFNASPPKTSPTQLPSIPTTGFKGTITVEIWDRDKQTVVPGLHADISGAPPLIVGGDRFVPLRPPITLASGFHGSIVASGSGVDFYLNGDVTTARPEPPSTPGPFNASTPDSGGGLIAFKTGSRRSAPGSMSFPTLLTGNSLIAQYGAATFMFEKDFSSPQPPPRTTPTAVDHFRRTLTSVNKFRWELTSIGLIILVSLVIWKRRRRIG